LDSSFLAGQLKSESSGLYPILYVFFHPFLNISLFPQGVAIIGAGVILNFQAITTYVIDAFTLHAASGIAATAFLRSICAFGFPLFAPAMYNALGFGLGNTILAIAGIVLGGPA
jgi:hypothetical protein